MVTGYNNTPATLQELIAQCQEWDGNVIKVVPYFREVDLQPGEYKAPALDVVGIWLQPVVDEQPGGDPYEQVWKLTGRGWVHLVDGGGDPCTNGGSVLTGRE